MSNTRGATAPIFAIGLPLLIGALGLAVEAGHWRQTHSRLQNTADAAAIAGARELVMTNSGGAIQVAAKGEAYENGLNLKDAKIQVFSPPQSGKHVGKDGVEILIESKQNRSFSAILSGSKVTHNVRAMALLMDGDPACILSLDNSAGQAIKVSGSSKVTVEGCVAHANSTASDAFSMGGSGKFDAACVSATGGVSASSGLNLSECDAPEEGFPAIADPYADVMPPANVSSMTC